MRISDWSSDVCSSDLFARYSDTRVVIRDEALAREPVTGLFSANDPAGFSRAVASAFDAQVVQGPYVNILPRNPAPHKGQDPFQPPGHGSPDCDCDYEVFDVVIEAGVDRQIGRAHVCTPVTNAHRVLRLLLQNKTL